MKENIMKIFFIIIVMFFISACSSAIVETTWYRHYKVKVECQGISNRTLYEMSCNKSICFIWYQDENGMRVDVPEEICIITRLKEYTQDGMVVDDNKH